ncbi:MAG: FAD-binding oxidoreductase, partial [Elusimicrobia bacterium]|nr:FAD-binding oxidoreductase [Elusimicrobiota bacterium]
MLASPPWAGAAAAPLHPPLREDARAPVCIVGGGLTGLLTALLLGRHGLRVIVLEQHSPGSGATGRSTGHLTTAPDRGYAELERRRGPYAARLVAESHSAAIELLSGLCEGHGIACDLQPVDGFLVGREGGERELDLEAAAARRAGLIEVERLGR